MGRREAQSTPTPDAATPISDDLAQAVQDAKSQGTGYLKVYPNGLAVRIPPHMVTLSANREEQTNG